MPEEQIIEIWETGSMRLAFNLKAVSQIQEMVYSGSGSNLSRNSGSGSEHDFYSLGNMFGYIVDDDCYRFYKYFSIK